MPLDALRLALLLAVALAPPIILAVRLRNAERHRREPWRVLWRAFAWGATGAAIVAILLESAFDARLRDATFFAPGFSVSVVLLAPLIEELLKALGLRFIDDAHPEPEDGYIYGGAVGLGFAATENTIYILSAFLTGGEQGAFVTALYRGIATVALHGAASAIAGRGIWRARYGGAWGWALAGVLAAVAIHVVYNALAAVATGWATLAAAALAVVAYLRMMRRVAVLDAHADH
ncbi:MAG TPA: PrsW family intramembrane metalloprotease [Candidatus Thermoplasmatota archaeon]|nr:PrsW family intramembrane metalloprotease [Candidatus Thermoplasmatota archaeon]